MFFTLLPQGVLAPITTFFTNFSHKHFKQAGVSTFFCFWRGLTSLFSDDE
jgi:hypothetical protein